MGNIWVAFTVSLAVTLIAGPLVIPVLRRLKFGQSIRSDGPSRHLQKAGTPTMGGIIFLAGTAAGGFLLIRSADGLIVLLMALGYGFIGFLDDYIKVVLKRSLGLRAREKLLGQVLLAAALAYWAVFEAGRGTGIVLPFSGFLTPGGIQMDLGWWPFLAFTVLLVVFMSNAVNLTDGLDGLAAGVSMLVALALVPVALAADRAGVAAGMAALAGGCLGFLFFNFHPAKVFMGDTGSLALGGGLCAAAVVTKSELLFLIIGGIYVLEALSVIIQVISFQTTGRRVFRMSPLHHHFELGGWSENRVVITFWALTLVFAAAGLAGLYRLV
ncbi:MAG: phospho-N-acetylmuramoyl-pentapeptide-transferase [Pelotomaculum sp.]|uniref:Phospho-N-acetylmuramoyl-pentapeptide-transferase n=1 Tax=Pelotomaculum thermopropionicum (strain DSM 13744 / JCM 10971 / SI) TaxID=370438 RepID=MRAY_PELTS|nr:RecName: Full=Phospho-N-acetylmuramoyl-pentapeptide-transferase; AltName: Full=UDP-MurNAc-pentapeptide phosphotransferase [Pelotomaculum thermopropionicum SI]NPV72708.1 phospho-N-acetylmuramoyl-pentapeptide-transferase [Pelotomaculum sp.]BAF60045.1 UDP-N-acetylmuramyl pentapeptide phosphotransferase/UDP-N-acetylglucosamine-1-phosphate transferase [Pelotomaculum thermopropionicum SI]